MANSALKTTPFSLLEYLRRVAQADQPVLYASLTNLASLLIGPVTLFLIARSFAPQIQGFYFTFASIISIQFLIELGLGPTLVQFASHEWSRLSFGKDGYIIGNSHSQSRLISLAHFAFKWYGLSAAIAIFILTPAGFLFISNSSMPGVGWEWPWVLFCFVNALNLLVLPIFYLLQGCNELSPYWYYRFIQQIIYGLSLCTAIFLGAGLWTLSIASGFVLSWSLFFIWRHYFKFLTFFFSRPVDGRVTWVNEIWPVQWRISISLLTAAFIPLFFTPILFRVSGPVVAGQMGLTISLNSILFALSSNWLATKAPLLGVLVAQNRYRESDALFLASFRASLKVILLGGAALLLGCFMFNITDHPLRWRILPPIPFTLLVAATAINSLINNLSIYFRAQKEEPIALTCLLGGLLVVSLSIILGSRFGVTGIACVYLAVLVFLQGPISFLIFFRSRGRRHENNILTGTERIH